MITRGAWRLGGSMAALLGLILVSSAAEASRARSLSLLGHPSFADDSDIFVFPATAPEYAGRGEIDVSSVPLTGSAGILAGYPQTIGLFVKRPELFTHTVGSDDVISTAYAAYPEFALRRPDKVADLIYSLAVTKEMSFGVGFSLSYGAGLLTAVTPDDIRATNRKFKSKALLVTFYPGVSFSGSDGKWDLGAEVSVDDYEGAYAEELEKVRARDTSGASFGVASRYMILPHDALSWLLMSQAAFNDLDAEMPEDEREASTSQWKVGVEVGPRYRPVDFLTTAISFGFGYDQLRSKTGTDVTERSTRSTLTLPIVQGGLEGRAWKRWLYRGAFSSRFDVQTSKRSEPKQRLTEASHPFGWSVGVGVELDRLLLETTVRKELITEGPEIIGGRGPGLFGLLSATYRFGKPEAQEEGAGSLDPGAGADAPH